MFMSCSVHFSSYAFTAPRALPGERADENLAELVAALAGVDASRVDVCPLDDGAYVVEIEGLDLSVEFLASVLAPDGENVDELMAAVRALQARELARELPTHPCPCASAMGFFEVLWHGEAAGDGGDLEEALTAYALVKPEDGNWDEACAEPGADPCIRRYASFDAFLDNADELETIPVTAAMIATALAQLP